MKTTKERMSEYLEKMQYLQRLCLGRKVTIDASYINESGTYVELTAYWKENEEEGLQCRIFNVREWHSKEENDKVMHDCSEFLEEKGWI